jgi:hypothetical protein
MHGVLQFSYFCHHTKFQVNIFNHSRVLEAIRLYPFVELNKIFNSFNRPKPRTKKKRRKNGMRFPECTPCIQLMESMLAL